MAKRDKNRVSNSTSEWKAFERLVGTIEKRLAPIGAVVILDDQVAELATGTLRQVDATIRAKVGSAELLVAIETRFRSRAGAIGWIDELDGKRRAIGAAKMIAVSDKGFSAAARRAAELRDIELRVLSEILPEVIDRWITGPSFLHGFKTVEHFRCEIELVNGDNITVDAIEQCLSHPEVHSPFPPVIFVQFAELREPDSIWRSGPKGEAAIIELHLDGQDPNIIPVPLGHKRRQGGLTYVADGEHRLVKTIKLTFDSRLNHIALQADKGRHFEYSSEKGEIVKFSAFQDNILGHPVEIQAMQRPDGSVSAEAQFADGFRMPAEVRSTVVSDMRVIDTKVLNMLPITLRIFGGEPSDRVLLKPVSPMFEIGTDLVEFDREYFIFMEKDDLRRFKRAAANNTKSSGMFTELAYIIPRSIVETIDLAPAINENVKLEARSIPRKSRSGYKRPKQR